MKKNKEVSIKQQTDTQIAMIVAVINKGYSDFVIDAARDAGATGATVISGRGTVRKEEAELKGMSLQSEKEVVLILVTEAIKKKVMQEISNRTHLEERGKGVCFSIPVGDVVGITPFGKK